MVLRRTWCHAIRSALPPKADLLGKHEKRLLLTHSGHSLDYGVQKMEARKAGGFPIPNDVQRPHDLTATVGGRTRENPSF